MKELDIPVKPTESDDTSKTTLMIDIEALETLLNDAKEVVGATAAANVLYVTGPNCTSSGDLKDFQLVCMRGVPT